MSVSTERAREYIQTNRTIMKQLLPIPTGTFAVAEYPIFLSNPIEYNPLLLSLILPTYKERDNIQKIVAILSNLLDEVIPGKYELIVVDDNSPDRTWEIAAKMMLEYPQLQVMRRIEEKGLSTAVIRGWQGARGKFLGVIDADLQHPPEILLKLLAQMERGVDLAVASRHVEGGGVSDWSLSRRFLSRGAQMLGLIMLPGAIGRLTDPMSGYFIVRRDAIVNIPLSPIGYKILIEVVARGKIRWIAEVGYIFQERKAGASKVTKKQYIEYLQHLLRLRLSLWPIDRFIPFAFVGFSGVFVDMAILYLLRDIFGLSLTRSLIISAEVAIINNFFWNDVWTFRDISQKQKGASKQFKRFLKFNIICLVGVVIKVILANILFNFLGLNEYLSNLIAIAVVTLCNFWFNLKLSWRVTDVGK